ncbi:hypothetical protein ACOMCU_00800 [Lysinibacillus sp. UGB7]|uniref:hypothetical protein n=1 Tax=Lysinibacillus sp. UGB7 TaxID=3411039 RepID=UPI003B796C8C
MDIEGLMIMIVTILIMKSIQRGIEAYFKRRKMNTYYAIYENKILTEYMPFKKATEYAENVHYDFRKTTQLDHKKRIINIIVDRYDEIIE